MDPKYIGQQDNFAKPAPIYCKYCGQRLVYIVDEYDTQTGEALRGHKECDNRKCRRLYGHFA